MTAGFLPLQSYANGCSLIHQPRARAKLNSKGTLRNRAAVMPAKSSYLSCNGAVCLSDITVTMGFFPMQTFLARCYNSKRAWPCPVPKRPLTVTGLYLVGPVTSGHNRGLQHLWQIPNWVRPTHWLKRATFSITFRNLFCSQKNRC